MIYEAENHSHFLTDKAGQPPLSLCSHAADRKWGHFFALPMLPSFCLGTIASKRRATCVCNCHSLADDRKIHVNYIKIINPSLSLRRPRDCAAIVGFPRSITIDWEIVAKFEKKRKKQGALCSVMLCGSTGRRYLY